MHKNPNKIVLIFAIFFTYSWHVQVSIESDLNCLDFFLTHTGSNTDTLINVAEGYHRLSFNDFLIVIYPDVGR